MIFKTIEPSPALKDFIDYYWVFETDDFRNIPKQFIYPMGGSELMIHYGLPFNIHGFDGVTKSQPQIFLCCQKLKSIEVSVGGSIGLIAVYFKPFGASCFFNLPFNELSDLNLSLTDFEGDKTNKLLEKIGNTSGINEKISIIEEYLIKSLSLAKDYELNILGAGISLINQRGGNISVDALADYSCLSNRQLERLFLKRIGLSPKQFIRIKKINFAIGLMQARQKYNLTRVAIDSGYYDQAHFINEFKKITGISPGTFASLCGKDNGVF